MPEVIILSKAYLVDINPVKQHLVFYEPRCRGTISVEKSVKEAKNIYILDYIDDIPVFNLFYIFKYNNNYNLDTEQLKYFKEISFNYRSCVEKYSLSEEERICRILTNLGLNNKHPKDFRYRDMIAVAKALGVYHPYYTDEQYEEMENK
jgi:hypothetical protein